MTSWFAIGIRKCLSQVAAADFGLTTMVDVSVQTVMRCEKKTCAALVYSFRAEALAYSASCRHAPGDSGAGDDDDVGQIVLHG